MEKIGCEISKKWAPKFTEKIDFKIPPKNAQKFKGEVA